MNKNPTQITTWADLKEFGINALTMESCSYSMRMLCDLNSDGAEHIRSFFGLQDITGFAQNWNSRVGEKPAIASILIPTSLFKDLSVFLLLRTNHQVVYYPESYSSPITGIDWETYEDYRSNLPGYFDAKRVYFSPNAKNNAAPQNDGRNVHSFTGRTS